MSDGCKRRPDADAVAAARHVLENVLCMQSTDLLLILAEPSTLSIAQVFLRSADSEALDMLVAVLPAGAGATVRLPSDLERLMMERSAFLAVTERGFTHTAARRRACENGARGLTMPRGTLELLRSPAVSADYRAIARAGETLSRALDGTNTVVVRSATGRDLTFDVSGGRWFAERGLCDRPGDFGNLPGGEVSIAPVDAHGTLVVDGSINPLGLLEDPLELTIEDRRVVGIRGPRAGELLRFLESFGEGAFNVAEIGIGTNPRADVTGIIVKDEKSLGTVHVGFGNNSNMGGFSRATKVDVPVHIDGVVRSPVELWCDGCLVDPRLIFEEGR